MEIVDRASFRSTRLIALIDWYAARSTADAWPPRSAFRPETMQPGVLPHVARVDVELAPFRVFYRAVGSVINESIGFELSGKYLDTLDIPQAADLAYWYRFALDSPGPVLVRGEQTVDGEAFIYEGCCLPFGTATDDPRAFVVGEDFLNTQTWRTAVRRRRYDRPA